MRGFEFREAHRIINTGGYKICKFGMNVFAQSQKIDNSTFNYLDKLKEMGYEGCEISLVYQYLGLINPNHILNKLKELEMDV